MPFIDDGLFARTAAWIMTYACHSTILIAIAWVVAKAFASRLRGIEETIWKTALLMGMVTTTLQVGFKIKPMQWDIPVKQQVSSENSQVLIAEETTIPFNITPDLSPIEMALQSEASAQPAVTPKNSAPFPWLLVLTCLWLIGTLLFLASLGTTLIRLHFLLKSRESINSGHLFQRLKQLQKQANTKRPIKLSVSNELRVPIAFGLFQPEICIPRRALTELNSSQQASMLAHELAHLIYRDPVWLRLMHVLEAIFFFQPLLRVANRHLSNLAELRCDDWAVKKTGQPHDLARCLTEVAGWTINPQNLPVPGMAKGEPILRQRIKRLLNTTHQITKGPSWLWRSLIVGSLGMIAMATPAIVPTAAPTASEPTVATAPEPAVPATVQSIALEPAIASTIPTVTEPELGAEPNIQATPQPASVARSNAPEIAATAPSAEPRMVPSIVQTLPAAEPAGAPSSASLPKVATLSIKPANRRIGQSKNHYKRDHRDQFEEVRELTIDAPKTLIVDGGRNGGITIKGWNRSDVRIVAKVKAYTKDEGEAEAIFSEIQVVAEDRIYAEGPKSHHWAVNYEIHAPNNIDVDLETYNGGISLAQLHGDIQFKALNGGVNLVDLGGHVRGRTTNGGVSIQLEGNRWNGEALDVETTNGGVELKIPEDFNAQLKTGTINGRLDFRFPITVQGEINKKFSTTLGKGGPMIRATTTNGGICIKNH